VFLALHATAGAGGPRLPAPEPLEIFCNLYFILANPTR
jgi:hypothetical protein